MATSAPDRVVHVIGGGTINHVRSHLALTAASYGGTARALHAMFDQLGVHARLHLTKMASSGLSAVETNADLKALTLGLLEEPSCAAIVFTAAVADFEGQIDDLPSGEYQQRLESRTAAPLSLTLIPSEKIVPLIKAARPDVLLATFKTTTSASEAEQLARGRAQQQYARADFVLANDTGTRQNLLLGGGGAVLASTTHRERVLRMLVGAILERLA